MFVSKLLDKQFMWLSNSSSILFVTLEQGAIMTFSSDMHLQLNLLMHHHLFLGEIAT